MDWQDKRLWVAVAVVVAFAFAIVGSLSGEGEESVYMWYRTPLSSVYYLGILDEDSGIVWPGEMEERRFFSVDAVSRLFTDPGNRTVVGELDVLQLPLAAKGELALLPYVHPYGFKPVQIVVHEESAIDSPEQLREKDIAVDLDRAAGVAALAALKSRYGVSYDELGVINVGNVQEAEKLLVLGTADAAVMWEDPFVGTPADGVKEVLWRPLKHFEERFGGALPLIVFGVSDGARYDRGLAAMERANASIGYGLTHLDQIRNASLGIGKRLNISVAQNRSFRGIREVSEPDKEFIQYVMDYAYANGLSEQEVNVTGLYGSVPAEEGGKQMKWGNLCGESREAC